MLLLGLGDRLLLCQGLLHFGFVTRLLHICPSYKDKVLVEIATTAGMWGTSTAGGRGRSVVAGSVLIVRLGRSAFFEYDCELRDNSHILFRIYLFQLKAFVQNFECAD